jgi:hypothetical protein
MKRPGLFNDVEPHVVTVIEQLIVPALLERLLAERRRTVNEAPAPGAHVQSQPST